MLDDEMIEFKVLPMVLQHTQSLALSKRLIKSMQHCRQLDVTSVKSHRPQVHRRRLRFHHLLRA
jgi:hypothetical protein